MNNKIQALISHCKECCDTPLTPLNKNRPALSPREERILKFFAEKWRKWHDPCNVPDPDGYKKTELSLAADDIDNFMVEEFETSWVDSKVEK